MRNPFRILSLTALALIVAACQTTSSDKSRTHSGAVLGDRDWYPIPISDSKFSIEGDAGMIVGLEANDLPDRRQERTKLADNGYVFFEKRHMGGFQLPSDLHAYLQRYIRNDRPSYTFTELKKEARKTGNLAYFVAVGKGRRCVLFNLSGRTPYFQGGSRSGEFNAQLSGYQCQADSAPEQAVIDTMYDFIERVVFDDGALSRHHAVTPSGSGNTPAPTASSVRQAAAKPAQRVVPVAFSWESHSSLMIGSLTYAPSGGEIAVTLPSDSGECKGAYSIAGGSYKTGRKPHGPWALSCSNGSYARGTFVSDKTGHGTGEGQDQKGNRITFTYGQ